MPSSSPPGGGHTATPTSAVSPGGTQPSTTQPSSVPVIHTPLPKGPSITPKAFASRVVLPDLGIDLPVVSGDLAPPPSYPFCDVTACVTRSSQPYEPGITYISAHAQKGMFLPILRASERNDGTELIGLTAQVFVSDGRRFDYTIEQVIRHAVDYTALSALPLDQQTLVLQTSEGPYGTVEKVQLIAALSGEQPIDSTDANPEPQPRDCEPSPSPSATPTGS